MHRVLFLLFFAIILTITAGCNNENEPEEQMESSITPVEVAAVKKGDFIIKSSIYGNVMPSKQIPVLSQHAGEIRELKVENGEEVKKDARLATIRTQMGSFGIFAPTAGKVGQLQLKKDDFYSGEEPFAIIYDDETVIVQFHVTNEMRTNFEKEQKVEIMIEEKAYEAEIILVENLPNEIGQFTIQAEIENEENEISPGAIAEVIVEEVRAKDTILVATDAIITESNETFVYIIENDLAKKVPVTIQEMQSDHTAVEAQLNENDQVITSGQFLLGDGSKVEVIKEGNES